MSHNRIVCSRVMQQVFRKLADVYGPLRPLPREDPLESLIGTILSQHTTDANSERAFRNLRRAFPRWEEVVSAPPAAVARAIRPGGLARVKSATIQKVLRMIRQQEGRLSLNRLREMGTAEALEYLLSLPGVGAKTARCVLLFALGRPVFPVDTHVFRVAQRLGWISPRTTPGRATPLLETMVPPRWRLPMHLFLVWHGRRVCQARRPHCSLCPLVRHCRTGRERGGAGPHRRSRQNRKAFRGIRSPAGRRVSRLALSSRQVRPHVTGSGWTGGRRMG